MRISIDVIRTEDGGVLVIPSETRVTAIAASFTQQADLALSAGDEGAATELRAQGQVAEAAAQEIRERFGAHIETIEFPARPYTHQEKKIARSKATSWAASTPTIDHEDYMDRLAAISLGWDLEKFGELPPSVAEALRSEIIERCEPDPRKLDFLSLQPSS